MRNLNKLIGVLAVASLASGCMGSLGDGDASSELIEVAPGTEPLRSFDSDTWMLVASTCEDHLPRVVEFRIAHSGVVVALDVDGIPVCSDSVEDVQDELVANGRLDESEELGQSYLVAVGGGVPGGISSGDPTPQPSIEAIDARERASAGHSGTGTGSAPGDDMDKGDPSPQPSRPDPDTI